MKKLLSFSLALACAATLFAQNPKQDFKNNRDMAADSYWAYPGPTKQLTPAPEGYTPYYISHYGRHGSRWLINPKDYTEPVGVLQEADKAGKLTATGKDVLRKMELLADAAKGRYGELTQRGAEQHKGIALRMAHNFPEVFAGPTNIDAKSTVVIRCIFSMENALHQLLLVNPQLNIAHDASYHDMYYMNLEDKKLQSRRGEESKKAFQAFKKKYVKPERVMNLLFNDKEYWKKNVDANNLFAKLIKNAANVQSTELRHNISLWPLFNDTEIYNYWKTNNAWWYISYGGSPLSGGIQPFSQRNLLRNIIATADSCLRLDHPGATLRYGHDTMVMPLTCLLDLDGLGKSIDDLEKIDQEKWCDYNIFPMACNIQFIFYRKTGTDPGDPADVIFKVLRNENEATLPIATDMAPYYRWSDFKAYFKKKLDSYDPEEARLKN